MKNLVKTRIPTNCGEFALYLYSEHGKEHLALVTGEVDGKTGVPTRVHSECLTGDVFGSRRCDCGDQLRHALQYLGRSTGGIFIYLRQEGRGIGLRKKLEAYNLQDQGLDTVEANLQLGHQPDERNYGIAARILNDLGVFSIQLITNNPHKVDELKNYGVQVESRIPIEVGQHADNLGYLRSKAEKMAHWLTFRKNDVPEKNELAFLEPLVEQLSLAQHTQNNSIFVTLSCVQSLNGQLIDGFTSNRSSVLQIARFLRGHHDAWLTTAECLKSTDLKSSDLLQATRCVILDPTLQGLPEDFFDFVSPTSQVPIVITTHHSDVAKRTQLLHLGVDVVVVSSCIQHDIDLPEMMDALIHRGIATLLIDGHSSILHAFLHYHFVNYYVMVIVPSFVSQSDYPVSLCTDKPFLVNMIDCQYQPIGKELVAYGLVNSAVY